MRKKGEKCVEKGENHSDAIYTNPIKNLPIWVIFESLSSHLAWLWGVTPGVTFELSDPLNRDLR